MMNGVWKVKYVEIRRGMFSYYENAVSNAGNRVGDPQGELLLRKNIPLEASTCTCRAVKLHQKALNFSPGGAIFELTCSTNSNIKRLWMAASREERQAWMQAINSAMVGGSVTRGDSLADHRGIVRTVSGRSPFKTDLRMFLKQQTAMRTARTSSEYLSALRELLCQSLHVPVKWVAKQVMLTGDNVANNSCATPSAFQEKDVELSIDQLWRDLQRDKVLLCGEVIHGDSHHGPERMLAALTRCLLSVGRDSESSAARSDLRESKALVYARDVLLAGNRTRSGGDSYYCVNTLCSNSDLVVVVPSGAEVEPVAIDVSEDESDEALHTRLNDKSGWIRTRSKLQRSWRKHFFVLSEGTLSYYEGAIPRPHGLRGQRVLTDASISIAKRKAKENGKLTNNDEFVLSISLKDGTAKDRLLLFESEDKLLDWVYALECVRNAKLSTEATRRAQRRRSSGNEEMFLAASMAGVLNAAQKSTVEHATKLGLDVDAVTTRLASHATHTMSAVRVSVSACTEYKVCTTNPQGNAEQDTWATIQAHFLQAFTITGGANGRIRRGEEIVRMSVLNCLEPSPPAQSSTEALSPSSMRARINRRIFRNPSEDGDGQGVVSD
jgi:PH domain